MKNEKEVLFLPFSAFEIEKIKKVVVNNIIYYEIDLNNLINFFKYNIILIPELNSVKNKIKLIMRIQNINDSLNLY